MRRIRYLLPVVTAVIALCSSPVLTATDAWQSTRVSDAAHHERTGSRGYPYRAKSEYILKDLDLREGDVVVDIGAGDGWWAERMAKFVGEDGVVHASEVEEKKVNQMKKKFAGIPQIRPYLCPADGTALPENSCELAFFSQTYHHLDLEGRVDYLRHLHRVVKPTGRVCIIEKYPEIATRYKTHGTRLSRLAKEAEQSGWIPVRYELMRGTYHYIVILVQKELFGPEP